MRIAVSPSGVSHRLVTATWDRMGTRMFVQDRFVTKFPVKRALAELLGFPEGGLGGDIGV